MNYQIDCEFSDPVALDGPLADYEYSKMSCYGTSTGVLEVTSTDPTLELIEGSTSSFYISKTFDYGDIFLAFCLMLFILFGIWRFLVGSWIPKITTIFKR